MTIRYPLTQREKRAQKNLRTIWDQKKRELGLTQEKAAEAMGLGTQGAVSHYLNGRLSLNLESTIAFAKILKVSPQDIDPEIPSEIQQMPYGQGVGANEREEVEALVKKYLSLPSKYRTHIQAATDSIIDALDTKKPSGKKNK